MNTRAMALTILWPSFLTAGVMEGAIFSLVDPEDLRWMGQGPLGAPPLAVYSVAFLVLWALVSTSGALTALLWIDPDAVDDVDEPARPAD